MAPLLAYAFFMATAAGVGIYLTLRRYARRPSLWRAAALELGLEAVEESGGMLDGRAGPLRVRISHSGSREGTLFSIWGPAVPTDLVVWPETPDDRSPREREIEVGDAEFDSAARVEGSPAFAHAVLDGETRRLLRKLFRGAREEPERRCRMPSGRLEPGVLRVEIPDLALGVLGGGLPDPFVGDRGRLADALAASIALARRLAAPDDLARRIVENLKGERVARVRRASLGVLVRDYPDDPATREALVAAREDPDADVRLRAAIALGPEGRDVLRALAAGEGADDDTTARAVAALEPDLTVDEAAGWLRSALRTRRVGTAEACTVALGRRGGPEAIALLGRVLAVETGDLARAAARALAMTGDAAAEEPLLRALAEGARDGDVRITAATALGHVGTAAAVGPLQEAAAGDAGMRRAARQAIAGIQSRLTGAEAGQLSLAAGGEGALTLAEDERGRVSVVGEEKAPLVPDRGQAAGRTR